VSERKRREKNSLEDPSLLQHIILSEISSPDLRCRREGERTL
jgi:hypothetical protein